MYNPYEAHMEGKQKVKREGYFNLRLPDDVREAIERRATRFDGNLTQEIVYSLRECLGLLPDQQPPDKDQSAKP